MRPIPAGELLVDPREEAEAFSIEARPADVLGVAYFVGGRLACALGLPAAEPARGESVIKRPSPLNAIKIHMRSQLLLRTFG
jgi:hypothetical protein